MLKESFPELYGVLCHGVKEDFSDVTAVSVEEYMALACEINLEDCGDEDSLAEYFLDKVNLLTKKCSEVLEEMEAMHDAGKSNPGREYLREFGRCCRTARLAQVFFRILADVFLP